VRGCAIVGRHPNPLPEGERESCAGLKPATEIINSDPGASREPSPLATVFNRYAVVVSAPADAGDGELITTHPSAEAELLSKVR